MQKLAEKIRSFELEHEKSKDDHESLVFGLPDKVMSRKEIFSKRLKLKKLHEEFLKHHSYKHIKDKKDDKRKKL